MPDLPAGRRRILAGAVAALLLLVAAGRMVLHRQPAAAVPPLVVPPATTAAAAKPVVVDVVGAVRRPGLYRLPGGSRVADAVARAGGLTRRAEPELVNLAAPIADGQQIVVPRRGAGGVAPATGAVTAPGAPVSLSTATLEQLDALPGVGPVTAQKILDYRQAHGSFSSVDELDAVPGIGPARMEELRKLVRP